MPSPADLVCAVRELGIKPTWLYACYQLQLRSGWLRLRTPVITWERAGQIYSRKTAGKSKEADQTSTGVFSPQKPLLEFLQQDNYGSIRRAEDILAGRFYFFGHQTPLQLGFPPDWNRQPSFEGFPSVSTLPANLHWTKVSTNAVDDIKYVWELSRFSWVFDLGRAHTSVGDIRFYEAFWTLFDSWCTTNAPNAGPQWISGQEAAIRLLAVTFAMDVFGPLLEKQPERLRALRVFIAAHAARLPATLLYARAQGNNHLVSEAVGLYAAGQCLRTHADSPNWRRLGKHWLEYALQDQVFPDGGYVQHSHTYARLALQAGLWGYALAKKNGDPLSESAVDLLKRLADLLCAVADPATGRVPNFGPNDGALLLPLHSLPIQDFRPTLQAAHALLNQRRVFPPGPWDELAFWLGADEILEGEYESPDIKNSFPQAGLYMLTEGETRAFLRCARFTNRPGHSDQLHLDLWWNGEPLAIDAGTYLYNAPDPWENSLVGAEIHNTVTINGQDPMRRAGRFLLLDWAEGEVLDRRASGNGSFELLTAAHNGYASKGLIHRRSVLRVEQNYLVVVDDVLPVGDTAESVGTQVEMRLSWLMPDIPLERIHSEGFIRFAAAVSSGPVVLSMMGEELKLSHYRGGELVDGVPLDEAKPTWGWVSPTYGEKYPGHMIITSCSGALPLRIVSRWAFNDPSEGLLLEWCPPEGQGCVLRSLRYGESFWRPDSLEEGGI